MSMEGEMFQRTDLLLGREAAERLASRSVILFGVGGVGSWCAEALVRSGITHLTIVDGDSVCPSNVNRQLMATSRTIGRPKVDAMRERLMEINPGAEITAVNGFYTRGGSRDFPLGGHDYVIDAIDSLEDKAALILEACLSGATLFSSMGAARRADPTRVRVGEFWKVNGCPLARALRNRFRRNGERPARKFLCVYSDELLDNRGEGALPTVPPGGGTAAGRRPNGSLVQVTGTFGFTLASLVVGDAIGK